MKKIFGIGLVFLLLGTTFIFSQSVTHHSSGRCTRLIVEGQGLLTGALYNGAINRSNLFAEFTLRF